MSLISSIVRDFVIFLSIETTLSTRSRFLPLIFWIFSSTVFRSGAEPRIIPMTANGGYGEILSGNAISAGCWLHGQKRSVLMISKTWKYGKTAAVSGLCGYSGTVRSTANVWRWKLRVRWRRRRQNVQHCLSETSGWCIRSRCPCFLRSRDFGFFLIMSGFLRWLQKSIKKRLKRDRWGDESW